MVPIQSLASCSSHFKVKEHFTPISLNMRDACSIYGENSLCPPSVIFVTLRIRLKPSARRKSPHFPVTCCNYCLLAILLRLVEFIWHHSKRSMWLSEFSFLGRLERCTSLKRNHLSCRASKELSWSTCSQMRNRREIKSYKCDESRGGLGRYDMQ